jgi:hypothetical protein
MIADEDVSLSDKYEIIYKGVNLGITIENINDYQLQTGLNGKELIIKLYNNSIPVLRDEKLNQILKK